MQSGIKKLFQLGRNIEDYTLVSILIGMMLLAVTQILLRNIFESGISWIDPLVRIGVLWIALIGAMIGTRQGGHISIDILAQYIPERLKNTLVRVTSAISASICALMSWVSVKFLMEEFEYGVTAFGAIPAWPFELIMPIGFTVMALRFATLIITGQQDADS